MKEYTFLPRPARAELKKRGIEEEALRATASADMTAEGDLRNAYLALTDRELIFMVSSVSGSASLSGTAYRKGGRIPWESESIEETYSFPLDRLSEPEILNQVVGGLLKVRVDGEETWLCRFSGTCLPRMARLCRHLEGQIGRASCRERV